jgi:hypothetical protein
MCIIIFEANARKKLCSVHYLSRFAGYQPTKFPPDYDLDLGPTHPITRILRVHAVETDPKFPRILPIHRVQISKISPDWEEYNSVGFQGSCYSQVSKGFNNLADHISPLLISTCSVAPPCKRHYHKENPVFSRFPQRFPSGVCRQQFRPPHSPFHLQICQIVHWHVFPRTRRSHPLANLYWPDFCHSREVTATCLQCSSAFILWCE